MNSEHGRAREAEEAKRDVAARSHEEESGKEGRRKRE